MKNLNKPIHKLNRTDWMKLIDHWMKMNGVPTYTWEEIVELEGGYGKDCIRTIDEATKPENEHTFPGRWFQSGQTDFGLYEEFIYVYSLLFGRVLISKNTLPYTAYDIQHTRGIDNAVLMDWGGSIFTAAALLRWFPEVGVVNFAGPQTHFGMWITDELEVHDRILWFIETDEVYADPTHRPTPNQRSEGLKVLGVSDWVDLAKEQERKPIALLSEVLEHIQSPGRYLSGKVSATGGFNDIYIANSFCTPAYGHHVPITISGEEVFTKRKANAALKRYLKNDFWQYETVHGYNSRVKHVWK